MDAAGIPGLPGGKRTTLPFLHLANTAFPGIYNGSWDNPTWDVSGFVNGGKSGYDASKTTSVVPNSSGGGCVDWGAVLFSTTLQNSDRMVCSMCGRPTRGT